MMAEISVENYELRTVREAVREMSAMINELKQMDKIVLTKQGKMVCVMMSVEQYANLLESQ